MTSEAACRPPSSAFKLNAICEKLARGPDDTPDLMAAASGDDTSAADDVTPDDVATGRGSSSSPRAPPPTSQDPASGGTTALEDDEDDDFGEEEEDEDDESGALNGALTNHSDNEQEGGGGSRGTTVASAGFGGEVPCAWPDTDSALDGRMRNKRKNFQPKNIAAAVFADSDEEEDEDEEVPSESRLPSERDAVDLVGDDEATVVASMRFKRSTTTAPLSPVAAEGGAPQTPAAGREEGPLDLSDAGSMRRKSQPVKRVVLNSVTTESAGGSGVVPSSRRGGFPAVVVDLSGNRRSDEDESTTGTMGLKESEERSSSLPSSPQPLLVRPSGDGASSPFVTTANTPGARHHHMHHQHHHHHHHQSQQPQQHPLPQQQHQHQHRAADASLMKDYAENTMKELLSMYGLHDVVESITKHVPLHHFSSGESRHAFIFICSRCQGPPL